MSWLYTLALVLHMLFAAGIVGLVLLQRGKGAEAGAGFGAGASGTVFGARGSSSFMSRSTAVLATLFFISSLSLAYLGGRPTGTGSVMDKVPAVTTTVITPSETPRAPTQGETAPVINLPAAPAPTPEQPAK